jgi:hypothetical protein
MTRKKREKRKWYVCRECHARYKAYPSGPPVSHKYCCVCYCKKSVGDTLSPEDEVTFTYRGWKQGDKRG